MTPFTATKFALTPVYVNDSLTCTEKRVFFRLSLTRPRQMTTVVRRPTSRVNAKRLNRRWTEISDRFLDGKPSVLSRLIVTYYRYLQTAPLSLLHLPLPAVYNHLVNPSNDIREIALNRSPKINFDFRIRCLSLFNTVAEENDVRLAMALIWKSQEKNHTVSKTSRLRNWRN